MSTEMPENKDAQSEASKSQNGNALQVQIEALEKQLAAAKEEATKCLDKALRAVAELENVKRRAEKDVESAHKFALERFSQALLPVLDSLEKSLELKADQADPKALQEGVTLTLKMFVDTVGKFGIEVIDPQGQVFDPHVHEAMAAVAQPGVAPNTVITVYQKGYRLQGRVVRPARVVVSKDS